MSTLKNEPPIDPPPKSHYVEVEETPSKAIYWWIGSAVAAIIIFIIVLSTSNRQPTVYVNPPQQTVIQQPVPVQVVQQPPATVYLPSSTSVVSADPSYTVSTFEPPTWDRTGYDYVVPPQPSIDISDVMTSLTCRSNEIYVRGGWHYERFTGWQKHYSRCLRVRSGYSYTPDRYFNGHYYPAHWQPTGRQIRYVDETPPAAKAKVDQSATVQQQVVKQDTLAKPGETKAALFVETPKKDETKVDVAAGKPTLSAPAPTAQKIEVKAPAGSTVKISEKVAPATQARPAETARTIQVSTPRPADPPAKQATIARPTETARTVTVTRTPSSTTTTTRTTTSTPAPTSRSISVGGKR